MGPPAILRSQKSWVDDYLTNTIRYLNPLNLYIEGIFLSGSFPFI